VGVRSHIMCTIWRYIPMTAHFGCAGRTCDKPCRCPWDVSLTYDAPRANVLSAGEGESVLKPRRPSHKSLRRKTCKVLTNATQTNVIS